jgi:hypothetical protein
MEDMEDGRLKRVDGRTRQGRATRDRNVTEDRELSDTERRAMLRNEFLHEALPNPPAMPGFHMMWLSTNHQYDTIQRRMRLGYVPVSADEVPGFETLKLKAGQWEGCVGVNEMVLFKIPEDVYRTYMEEFHHNMPLEEEGKLKEMVDQAVAMPGNLVREIGDGMDFSQNARTRPKFE